MTSKSFKKPNKTFPETVFINFLENMKSDKLNEIQKNIKEMIKDDLTTEYRSKYSGKKKEYCDWITVWESNYHNLINNLKKNENDKFINNAVPSCLSPSKKTYEKIKEYKNKIKNSSIIEWNNMFTLSVLAPDYFNNNNRKNQILDLSERVYSILYDCYEQNRNEIITLDGHGRTIWCIYNVWNLFFKDFIKFPKIIIYEINKWSYKYHKLIFPNNIVNIKGNILNNDVFDNENVILFLNFCVISDDDIMKLLYFYKKSLTNEKKMMIFMTTMVRKWAYSDNNMYKKRGFYTHVFIQILRKICYITSYRGQICTFKFKQKNNGEIFPIDINENCDVHHYLEKMRDECDSNEEIEKIKRKKSKKRKRIYDKKKKALKKIKINKK